jgi:hypothetical protein
MTYNGKKHKQAGNKRKPKTVKMEKLKDKKRASKNEYFKIMHIAINTS